MPAGRAFAPQPLHAANPGLMTGGGNWTYLLPGRSAATLVDAGVGRPEHLAALDAALAAHRLPLLTLIVTHGHRDHVSGAPAVVAAHPGVRCLKHPWPVEDRRWPVTWHPLFDGQEIDVGDATLVAWHTPGHAPDHCALWHEDSRTLFCGDLIIPGGSVVIQIGQGGDMQAYLDSLARVIALRPERLLPSHGAPIEQPRALLAASVEHRLERERQVLAAVGAGHATVAAIVESIYHGLPRALMAMAEENVRAHLVKLQRERRVSDLWRDDSRPDGAPPPPGSAP